MKFSDFPQAVIKENVDYTVKEITNVIKKYGPRESGNENSMRLKRGVIILVYIKIAQTTTAKKMTTDTSFVKWRNALGAIL